MAWQSVRIEIPPGFDPKTRENIGLDIIDFIKNNSNVKFSKNVFWLSDLYQLSLNPYRFAIF